MYLGYHKCFERTMNRSTIMKLVALLQLAPISPSEISTTLLGEGRGCLFKLFLNVYQRFCLCMRAFIYSNSSHIIMLICFRDTRISRYYIIFGWHVHELLDSWKHHRDKSISPPPPTVTFPSVSKVCLRQWPPVATAESIMADGY